MNIECRMSNIEGMNSVDYINGLSEAKPPFNILRFDIRYSAVRCLTKLGHRKAIYNQIESLTCGVSYA
jgi:hypothetical protein